LSEIPLKSIYALLLIQVLTISRPAWGTEPDTIPFHPTITLGYDVSGQVMRLLNPEASGHGITLNFEWRPHWMAVLEAGATKIEIREEKHSYFSQSRFLKAGVNYNLLQKQPLLRDDQIFLLLRYGFGWLNHEAPHIIIKDGYWGEASISFEKAKVMSHWAEIGGGLRTRLAGNIFIGWDIRLRLMLAQNLGSGPTPFYVSGFGRNHNNTSAAFQYFIYYKIPIK